LSSENIDILKKNNVILPAVRVYGFWEHAAESPFRRGLPVGLSFYELAAPGDLDRLTKYDKWWNLLINGLHS
jgi:hypothetical protein